ncbi:MAG: hypothetical protein PHF86_05425 [Candidatus Nanoarchaeia archaeon]|nr:hypothetical protein [Candidatus Nanoarchaeia archaeon]
MVKTPKIILKGESHANVKMEVYEINVDVGKPEWKKHLQCDGRDGNTFQEKIDYDNVSFEGKDLVKRILEDCDDNGWFRLNQNLRKNATIDTNEDREEKTIEECTYFKYGQVNTISFIISGFDFGESEYKPRDHIHFQEWIDLGKPYIIYSRDLKEFSNSPFPIGYLSIAVEPHK